MGKEIGAASNHKSRMQLYHIVSGHYRSSCSSSKIGNHFLYPFLVQCFRQFICFFARRLAEGATVFQPPSVFLICAIPFPGCCSTGFAACMCQLDTGVSMLLMNKNPEMIWLSLAICSSLFQCALVIGRDAAFGRYCSRFGQRQSSIATARLPRWYQVLSLAKPLDRRILAHRRHALSCSSVQFLLWAGV